MYRNLAGTIACAALATANVIVPKSADDIDPSCNIGNQTILYPAPNTNITQEYYNASEIYYGNRPPFPFRYCSGQYFKTSSRNIQVLLSAASSIAPFQNDPVVLAEANSTGALDGGYILNITVPGGQNSPPASDSWLIVLETYYSYYVPLQTTITSIPIKF